MATETATLGRPVVARRKSAGIWRDAWSRLRRNKLALIGLGAVFLLLLAGMFGPTLAPWPYYVQDQQVVVDNGFRPLVPFQSAEHPLGTDYLGHDLLSRMLDGAQISITVAFVVQIVVLLIGLPIGALAGWFGGRTDSLLMRFTDVMYAFPDLLLIILMAVTLRETFFGRALSGMLLIFVAIGLTAWVTVARLVRGQFLSLKEMDFVEAARAMGVRDRSIIIKHLLPNAIGPIIVAVTLGIPGAILAEATLSFLNVGVQPPRASWGSLINDGIRYIRSDPHMVLMPAIAIASALLSFTFLGDGLRDALDPKLKGKQ